MQQQEFSREAEVDIDMVDNLECIVRDVGTVHLLMHFQFRVSLNSVVKFAFVLHFHMPLA
jgi:hypothetical protein